MPAKIDLHMHTTFSDGVFTPSELVRKAKDVGLNIISITDHDNINGLEEAISVGKEIGVEVIPGVEISTDIDNKEIHLLGYFLNIHDAELQKYLNFFREERFHRAKRMVKKLNKLGMTISMDDVLEIANNSAIGRPHVAIALTKLKQVANYFEAFDRYIGDNCPAYERKIHVSPQSALKLISDAGGLSFIAHPSNIDESILMHFIKAGIDGIEVVHPSHNQFQIKFYRGIVNHYCLLESGGSDFHGGIKNDEGNLGKYLITQSKLEEMKQMLIRQDD